MTPDALADAAISALLERRDDKPQRLRAAVVRHALPNGQLLNKHQLIAALKHRLLALPEGDVAGRAALLHLQRYLTVKPRRLASGVAPITVLTPPFPCPGRCIFCPNDARMPKSYVALEPGAQRALLFGFSAYEQMQGRLTSLLHAGHDLSKLELLILGGTWSSYPEAFQRSFVHALYRAANEFDEATAAPLVPHDAQTLKHKLAIIPDATAESGDPRVYNLTVTGPRYERYRQDLHRPDAPATLTTLQQAQTANETAAHRVVGLSIETRSDHVDWQQCLAWRQLGVTKVQLGVQTLDDGVSALNLRDETAADVAQAFFVLRACGFKIQAHMMPGLYGSSPQQDIDSHAQLMNDVKYQPDEVKIYPVAVQDNTILADHYRAGRYVPYTPDVMAEVLRECVTRTKRHCRLSRLVRDLPSSVSLQQSFANNARETVAVAAHDIRAREPGPHHPLSQDAAQLKMHHYPTSAGMEWFLSFESAATTQHPYGVIYGFLRLLLPNDQAQQHTYALFPSLRRAALIREVHVYGRAQRLGEWDGESAQHQGLGRRLIDEAQKLAQTHGFDALSVIAAVGTRKYYERLGFLPCDAYHRRPVLAQKTRGAST